MCPMKTDAQAKFPGGVRMGREVQRGAPFTPEKSGQTLTSRTRLLLRYRRRKGLARTPPCNV